MKNGFSILLLIIFGDLIDGFQNLLSGWYETFWFHSASIIYFMLLLFGILSFTLWIYGMLTLQLSEMMPEDFVTELRSLLLKKRYDKALKYCKNEESLSARFLAKGIEARMQGPLFVKAAIKEEGVRFQKNLWDKLCLLQEISIAAPIVGLLGSFLSLTFTFAEHSEKATFSFVTAGLISLVPLIIGSLISVFSACVFLSLKRRTHFLLDTIQKEIMTYVMSQEWAPQ